MKDIVLAFDVYGTLLDTNALAARFHDKIGIRMEVAVDLVKLWRRYQLEYVLK